jgi:hypothetical protein
MKTPLVLAVVFLGISTPLFSQATTRDALVQQLGRETCDEITRMPDVSKMKTPEEVKMSVGLAVAKVLTQHQNDLKSLGIVITDAKGLEPVARDVGMALALSCPQFISILTGSPELLKPADQSAKGSISGTLRKVVDGDFTYLQVEDAKGKIEKLWWLEYFDGSNKLLADSQGRMNKPIKVNYVEKEMFNSTLKDYVKMKVITGVE